MSAPAAHATTAPAKPELLPGRAARAGLGALVVPALALLLLAGIAAIVFGANRLVERRYAPVFE